MRPIEEALEFAEGRHAGQLFGDQPYMYHIRGVVAIARSLGLDETVQVECALHDVVEDDKASALEVGEKFGHDIAAVVLFLARSPEETYGQYVARVATSPVARMVKICDLLFNLEQSAKPATRTTRLIRYERALYYLATHPTVGVVTTSVEDNFLDIHRISLKKGNKYG